MTKRIALIVAALLACLIAESADARGFLRRRLCPPRVYCEPPAPAPAKVEPPETLEGRVTFKESSPKIVSIKEKTYMHPDKEEVWKAPAEFFLDPTWRIDPKTRGVANVCVFLKRPKDGVLPIQKEDKVRSEPVVMETPFTFFRPHMVALYQEWNDGKEHGKTGERFIIKNTSTVATAPRAVTRPKYNPPFGMVLPPGPEVEYKFNPQPVPVLIISDLHPWAQAHAWVFDHPYFAITKADGTFVIPRVPAGMEVTVQAWHESQGWLLTLDGKSLTLTKGKNVLDFEISLPK